MALIYRWTTFPALVDMVQRSALSFVLPSVWDDPYEGYIFSALRSETGRLKIASALRSHSKVPDVDSSIAILSLAHSAIHCQSWSKVAESDALWRIYADEQKAVRISIKAEDISDLKVVARVDVKYVDAIKIEDEIEELLSGPGSSLQIAGLLRTKRRAFEHEQEIRLMTHIDMQNLTAHQRPPNISLETMTALMRKLHASGEISATELRTGIENFSKQMHPLMPVRHVSFKDIQNFIQSVMLHPMAPSWLDEALAEYCSRNGLVYEGKSKLYQLII